MTYVSANEKAVSLNLHRYIEVPRAALVAKQLVAAGAQFFSFGTNDLTQMTLGFSRDDVVGQLYNLCNAVQPWLASAWVHQRTWRSKEVKTRFQQNLLFKQMQLVCRYEVASILGAYISADILQSDPFQSIDREGVGRLIEMCVKEGREVGTTEQKYCRASFFSNYSQKQHATPTLLEKSTRQIKKK
jgi:phosphoenolpyruvate synthase/pyruvate phosphate dikinase